jgi:hypothetical protein
MCFEGKLRAEPGAEMSPDLATDHQGQHWLPADITPGWLQMQSEGRI